MEKSCVQMAYPGKIGFLILGIFFILAFASWNVVRQPDVDQEEVNIYREIEQDTIVFFEPPARSKHNTYEGMVLATALEKYLDKEDNGKDYERLPTFLSSLEHSFVDMQITADNGVPTIAWLNSCSGPKSLLTSVGSSMDKIWGDVGTNLDILQRRYESSPQKYGTLQEIVIDDINRGVAENDGSAALAVLWLKRCFEFLLIFFRNLEKGQEPPQASSNAYENTLAKHHNFFMRAVFYTAMKTLGNRNAFYSQMALTEEDFNDPSFEKTATQDMKIYTDALARILIVLDEFLISQGLNKL